MSAVTLEEDGAELAPSAAQPDLVALDRLASSIPQDVAGVRLYRTAGLTSLVSAGSRLASLVSTRLGRTAFPVRALLFDKSPDLNWSLGWHQDRTIVVRGRCELPGFGPWTLKAGLLHVAPPFDLLARMVTVRVHLDAVHEQNAPLLVAPGSHRLGRVAEADLAGVVERCGTRACLANPGDVWLYATPILHASEAATNPKRRRVLQVDYAVDQLPYGLDWLGVD